MKGSSGSAGGNLVFEVANDGTVYVRGIALTSDRNAKENLHRINPSEVLDKVASLPITEWNFKTDPALMAQDFHAGFDFDGGDDKHISMADEGGVALAAIQGLNKKVESGTRTAEKQLEGFQAGNGELKADSKDWNNSSVPGTRRNELASHRLRGMSRTS